MKKIKTVLAAILCAVLAVSTAACGDGGKGEYLGVESLKGKVVANIGENNVPDLIFKTVLRLKGIEYVASDTPVEGKVALSYAAESGGVSGLVLSGKAYMGIMAEPSVSSVLAETDRLDVKLDVQRAYYDAMQKTDGSYGYPQAVLVVKNDYAIGGAAFTQHVGEPLKNAAQFIKADFAVAEAALKRAGSNIKALTAAGVDRSALCYKTGAAFIEQFNTLMAQFAVLGVADFTLGQDKFFDFTAEGGLPTKKAELYAPDGSTALSLAPLAHSGQMNVTIVPPDQIAAKVITGAADMAVLPANVAAKLIKEGKPYKVACAVTNGNLYGLVKI